MNKNMDELKKEKFNKRNKSVFFFLKITALVVIGAFLLNVVFIDLAWA